MDKYDVLKYIGKGTFSNVYLCKGTNEMLFVVKEVNLKSKKQVCKRILQIVTSEIEVLKRSNHENIVKYYNYINNNNNVYSIHLEYCEYGDVFERAVKGVTEDFCFKFIKQMSSALVYLEQENIIHRDVKLENILIKKCNDGTIFKLSDFGFACLDLSCNKGVDKGDLAEGYFKVSGTLLYMAPEIINNIALIEKQKMCLYGKSADIWSLGICLYELVHKCFPFHPITNMYKYREYLNNDFDINEKLKTTTIHEKMKCILVGMLQICAKERLTATEIYSYITPTPSTNTSTNKLIENRSRSSSSIKITFDDLCGEGEPKKTRGLLQWVLGYVFG